MKIKVGDYVESLHGMVGVVKTVGSTVFVGDNEQFAFDWEITRPSVRVGYSGCFSGNESELWQHYRQIGLYRNPFRKEKTTKQKIEPIEFGKIEKARATKVTISTNRDVKTERGEFDTLKLTKLTVTDLAVKINEIINYLNAEECYWGILQPPYGENLCGSIYRGLTSTIRYDVDDNLYIGAIVGIKDTVAFHGRTLNECLHSSEKAVDKYLKMILEER